MKVALQNVRAFLGTCRDRNYTGKLTHAATPLVTHAATPLVTHAARAVIRSELHRTPENLLMELHVENGRVLLPKQGKQNVTIKEHNKTKLNSDTRTKTCQKQCSLWLRI